MCVDRADHTGRRPSSIRNNWPFLVWLRSGHHTHKKEPQLVSNTIDTEIAEMKRQLTWKPICFSCGYESLSLSMCVVVRGAFGNTQNLIIVFMFDAYSRTAFVHKNKLRRVYFSNIATNNRTLSFICGAVERHLDNARRCVCYHWRLVVVVYMQCSVLTQTETKKWCDMPSTYKLAHCCRTSLSVARYIGSSHQPPTDSFENLVVGYLQPTHTHKTNSIARVAVILIRLCYRSGWRIDCPFFLLC